MWDETEDQLRSRLGPDEILLWSGRPRQGLLLRGSDAFVIPFSLVWGGGAIAWEVLAFVFPAPLIFKLCGIPFVLLGLYLMVGRFFVDARSRAKTYYGITNQRILIVSGLFGQSVKSLHVATLTDVTLT